jgi:hypothetical protein
VIVGKDITIRCNHYTRSRPVFAILILPSFPVYEETYDRGPDGFDDPDNRSGIGVKKLGFVGFGRLDFATGFSKSTKAFMLNELE